MTSTSNQIENKSTKTTSAEKPITEKLLKRATMVDCISEENELDNANNTMNSDSKSLKTLKATKIQTANNAASLPLGKSTKKNKNSFKNRVAYSKHNNRSSEKRISFLLFVLLLILVFALVCMAIYILFKHPSPSPSSIVSPSTPVSDRLLLRISPNSDVFLDSSTTQSKAKAWLISSSRTSQIGSSRDYSLQRYILAVFYFSTNGPSWREPRRWLSNSHECTWFGITCNKWNEVTMIWLPENYLAGPLPIELAYLSPLDTITLNDNELSGTIPSIFFSYLRHLRQFSLYGNRITGTIPLEMYELPSLEYIGLQDNLLEGVISKTVGNLKKLRTLYLHGNQLVGTIPPELGNVESLVELALEGNYLRGTLPAKLGNLPKLRWFSVQNNKLTSTIPKTFGNFKSMKTLYLYNNLFMGSIPEALCQMDLTQLYTDCGGNNPKVSCSCCTACCSSTGCYKDKMKSMHIEF